MGFNLAFNPLNANLNPICHLLALLGAHHILHVSSLRVKGLNPLFLAEAHQTNKSRSFLLSANFHSLRNKSP